MSTGYPSNWDEIRRQVYQRDNYTCQNCGAGGGVQGSEELHAHHIVPVSSGGSHQPSNLVTMCSKCHNAIHTDALAPTGFQSQPAGNQITFVKYLGRNEVKLPLRPIYDELVVVDNFSEQYVEVGKTLERYIESVIKLATASESSFDDYQAHYENRKNDLLDDLEKLEECKANIDNISFPVDGADQALKSAMMDFNDVIEQFHTVIDGGDEFVSAEVKQQTGATTFNKEFQTFNESIDLLRMKIPHATLQEFDGIMNRHMNQGASTESCFIATAAFGSPHAVEIDVLRNFRDNRLSPNWLGRHFIKTYYHLSPPIANWISKSERRRRYVRQFFISPLIALLQKLDMEN